MSIAAVAAQQSTAQTGSTSASTSKDALSTLSSNFQDFLGMLMTQLKNQDPTSPMDTNQFTTELVQFSSVEQQINTNSSLTQLISLTQSGQMLQSSSLVGRSVQLSSDHIPLQGGSGSLSFNATTAGSAAITITTDSGTKLLETTIDTKPGSNTWTWDGKSALGGTLPDGSYKVVVTGAGPTGAAAALPFTVSGKVTGVQKTGTSLQLQLGAQTADFSTVQSVAN